MNKKDYYSTPRRSRQSYVDSQYKKSISKPLPLKTIFFSLIALIVAFPLIRFIIRQYNKFKGLENEISQENFNAGVNASFIENKDPIVAQNKADKICANKGVQTAAKALSHHLGTKYKDNDNMKLLGVNFSWLDPRSWTENDKEIANILMYQNKNYHYVKILYNQIYTKGRNLTDDILELLDEKELARVKTKLILN